MFLRYSVFRVLTSQVPAKCEKSSIATAINNAAASVGMEDDRAFERLYAHLHRGIFIRDAQNPRVKSASLLLDATQKRETLRTCPRRANWYT